jgi:hypothetical protein
LKKDLAAKDERTGIFQKEQPSQKFEVNAVTGDPSQYVQTITAFFCKNI